MSNRRIFYHELVYVAFTCTDPSRGSHVNANTRLHPSKCIGPTPIYLPISDGYQWGVKSVMGSHSAVAPFHKLLHNMAMS